MSEERNLDYYLQNPNAIGDLSETDFDALLAGDQSVTPTEPVEDAEPLAATEDVTDDALPEAEEQSAEESVVLTKDGKHTIPYTELESARTEAKMLKQTVTNLNDTIRQLQERVESGAAQAGDKDPGAMTAEMMSEEALQSMEEDFPEIGKVVRQQQAVIHKLMQDVGTLSSARQEEQMVVVVNQAQVLIDANPKLSWLQSNDPEGFQRAVEFDEMLKAKAEWQGLDKVPDRFNKVAALYEAMYGAIQNPQTDIPAPAKAGTPAPKKAAQKIQAPVSLSQIPGGEPPAVDDLGAVENTNGSQMLDWFHGKSSEQIWARIDKMM